MTPEGIKPVCSEVLRQVVLTDRGSGAGRVLGFWGKTEQTVAIDLHRTHDHHHHHSVGVQPQEAAIQASVCTHTGEFQSGQSRHCSVIDCSVMGFLSYCRIHTIPFLVCLCLPVWILYGCRCGGFLSLNEWAVLACMQ